MVVRPRLVDKGPDLGTRHPSVSETGTDRSRGLAGGIVQPAAAIAIAKDVWVAAIVMR
jgi:hypothetical protein